MSRLMNLHNKGLTNRLLSWQKVIEKLTEWHNYRLSVWEIEKLSPHLSVSLSDNLSVCMSVYGTDLQIDRYAKDIQTEGKLDR